MVNKVFIPEEIEKSLKSKIIKDIKVKMKTEKLIKIIDLILVLTVIIAGACLFIGIPYYTKSILSIYIFIFNIIILCFIVILKEYLKFYVLLLYLKNI